MLANRLTNIIKSKLITDAGTYTVFSILQRLVPFIVLPIISRSITKEDMGLYIVYQSIMEFFIPFISLNADNAVLVNYYKVDKENHRIYFFNALLVLSTSLIFIFIVLLFFSQQISSVFEFPAKDLWAVLIIALFTIFSRLTQNLYQVERKPMRYGLYSIFQALLKGGSLLYFVVILKDGWPGIINSQVFSSFIIFFVSLIILYSRKAIKNKISTDYIYDCFRVGWPLTLHQIGAWFASQSNRIIINVLIGSAATGSFGIGAIYGTVVSVIQNSFNMAFVPYLFENLNKITESGLHLKNKIIKLTYIYNGSLLIIALFIGILGLILNNFIFGVGYDTSRQYIIWMVLGNAFNGMYKMHVNYIFYEKKTYYLLYITTLIGILNILLTYIMVSIFGAIGGAIVYAFTEFIGYVLAWYFGNLLVPLPWFNFKFKS